MLYNIVCVCVDTFDQLISINVICVVHSQFKSFAYFKTYLIKFVPTKGGKCFHKE